MNRKQRREAASAGDRPAFVQAFEQGLALHQAGRLDEAAVAYRRAMAVNPVHPTLLNNLSILLYAQGKLDEAEAMQRQTIALDPNMAKAYNNLGVTLNATHCHAEAMALFQRAIELEPANTRAINNLGDSLVKVSRFAEGLEYLRRAVTLEPGYAEAHSNIGMALWGLGKIDDAIAAIKHAITLQPTLDEARKNLGIIHLLKGDYAEGWKLYELRPLFGHVIPRPYKMPRWQGQDLNGGVLLVWSEQGIGDEVLYASMLPDLAERSIRVLWESDPRLAPLFQRSEPRAQVFGRRLPPQTDFGPGVVAQIPAGSLGQYLRPSAEHFPKARRQFLRADKARSDAYRARLALAPNERLVGISWLSKNAAFGESKSSALTDWADTFRVPGYKFVDLQYGDTARERGTLKDQLGLSLHHVDGLDLHRDIDGMAALTAACDLVVTVSNSTAHVAGGLGVPTWVLVPAGVGKFWYWGINTETTPWYPCVTLLRQGGLGRGWRATLAGVAERLTRMSNP